jgi:signal transduction histidine kinase
VRSTRTQLSPSQGSQSDPQSPMRQLLHALNQPLTGLQCALELAVTRPRKQEEILRTLREGLELTARMRLLAEALRELSDVSWFGANEGARPVDLDNLLRSTISELAPVAEVKQLQFEFECETALTIVANPDQLSRVLFRLLDSVVALAKEGTTIRVSAPADRHDSVAICWKRADASYNAPLPRAEVGVLIAQAGWQQAGGQWTDSQEDDTRVCTLTMR